jgi:glycosyltransferase involved in cell wall biosynthesis
LKILISALAFFPNSFGGGEIWVYRVSKELLKRGHLIKVLTPGQWKGGKDPYSIDSYTFEDIPLVSYSLNPNEVTYLEDQLGFGSVTSKILQKEFDEFRPDIVHINGIKPALINLCNELNINHLVSVHHAGIVCPAGAFLRPNGSVCNVSVNTKDCVPCCNVWRRQNWHTGVLLSKVPPFIYRRIGKRLKGSKKLSYIERGLIYSYLVEQSIEAKKMLIEHAQHFIAPSRAIYDLLILNACDPKKISIRHHGIEPLRKLPLLTFDGRPLRFGYVGRIDLLKGLHVLLKALKLLPNGKRCELHIFGATRNRWDEEYRRKALSNYHGNVKLFDHGFIPHAKLDDVYSSIDVLVVPSILPEAFGLVVAEAFSAGRPVIVTNSGALQELVRDGIDGLVVERNDSKVLAEAMQKFIENPDLILEMSNQIRPVKTIQQYVDEIEKIYRQLIYSKN